MDQQTHQTQPTMSVIPQPQRALFSPASLPRQLRMFKSELEDEFLPPRDHRLRANLPH